MDILESARLALGYVSDITREEFLVSVQVQDAVVRRLEIIGEAARRLSPAARAALPSLPWADMIGMRNIMIHEYDDVDLATVWDTATLNLPPLISTLATATTATPIDQLGTEEPADDA